MTSWAQATSSPGNPSEEERAPSRLKGLKTSKKKGTLAIKMRGLSLQPQTCSPVLPSSVLGRSDFEAKKMDAVRINIVHIALHIFINISAVAPPHCLRRMQAGCD